MLNIDEVTGPSVSIGQGDRYACSRGSLAEIGIVEMLGAISNKAMATLVCSGRTIFDVSEGTGGADGSEITPRELHY